MRLKLDENLGIRWRDRLRVAGHDVDTVGEEGLKGAEDASVLEAAIEARRALVTLDLDFANPLRFPPHETHGIAVLRVKDRPGRQDLDQVVDRLIAGLSRGELDRHLWVVGPERIREYKADPDG